MIRLWCEQADGHTFRMRVTLRNSAVTGVSAMTLIFSPEPGAQAYTKIIASDRFFRNYVICAMSVIFLL